MKSYKEVRKELQAGEQPEDDNRDNDMFQCLFCGNPTTRAAMSNYGARCWPCFDRYCEAPQPKIGPSPAALKIKAEIAAWQNRFSGGSRAEDEA
jgi:hypothetical protein